MKSSSTFVVIRTSDGYLEVIANFSLFPWPFYFLGLLSRLLLSPLLTGVHTAAIASLYEILVGDSLIDTALGRSSG